MKERERIRYSLEEMLCWVRCFHIGAHKHVKCFSLLFVEEIYSLISNLDLTVLIIWLSAGDLLFFLYRLTKIIILLIIR